MIHLSRAAICEVKRLCSKYPTQTPRFRLEIKPGGCSDFYYSLYFNETAHPEDLVLSYDDVTAVVSAQTLPYIEGATLDYSEDLMGGGFRFHNPNAATHCSCGNSFSMQSLHD
jgi:iron-sulfur cluster assembly protein